MRCVRRLRYGCVGISGNTLHVDDALLVRVAFSFFFRPGNDRVFAALRSIATEGAVRLRRFALRTRIVEGEKISTTT